MELILLRHGAVAEAYQKRYLGHTDIPIDPELFDAEKLSPLLGVPYDRVYSSDLSRCTETLGMMGISDYAVDPRLREVCFKKEIEGKTFAQIETMEGFDPCSLESMENWHAFVCEEPFETFRQRIRDFLEELSRNETILICTHAGTIREILALLRPDGQPVTPGYLEHTVVRVK